MAEAPLPEALPDLDVIIDPDFEPKKRPRSCTWPLPRPDSSAVKPESTEPDIIPEEEDDEEDSATPTAITVNGFAAATEDQSSNSPVTDGPFPSPGHDSGSSPLSTHSPTTTSGALTPSGLTIAQTPRKASSRRNAWGNLSYADLITKAIESSPEKRLTLSQIYDWMVRSIPYFKDKGDSNSSAGWKAVVWPTADNSDPVNLSRLAYPYTQISLHIPPILALRLSFPDNHIAEVGPCHLFYNRLLSP
ncbi:hypothetical protein XENOCAPTIV_025466 [Xenoophorus captivus]|uniref:Fork-head domain-containing protein n=1 Tax=Xenoophorus captivus TaxID=1517983 RepID=A0ABV0RN92_9TELE